jgi:hypothetical protein
MDNGKGMIMSSDTSNLDEIVNGIMHGDLFALTFHDKDHETLLKEQINQEKEDGKRDKFFLPVTYRIRKDNEHFVDTGFKDEWQKEVYIMAQLIMLQLVPKKNGE